MAFLWELRRQTEEGGVSHVGRDDGREWLTLTSSHEVISTSDSPNFVPLKEGASRKGSRSSCESHTITLPECQSLKWFDVHNCIVQCSVLCNKPTPELRQWSNLLLPLLSLGATWFNDFHLCLLQFGQVWQGLHSPGKVTWATKFKVTHSFAWKMILHPGENLHVKYLHGPRNFRAWHWASETEWPKARSSSG